MPSALILIADGTEETEFVATYDLLVRAEVETQSCGVNLKNDYATCSRNVRILPDTTTLPSQPTADILILPGGMAGARTFAADAGVQDLIRAYREAGRWTAFICAGTSALIQSVFGAPRAARESANKVRVTSHPVVRGEAIDFGWAYAPDEERVVVDGRVITSRGPGSAILFALTIVEVLCGMEKREFITAGLMVANEL